jgi:hypothetical protein
VSEKQEINKGFILVPKEVPNRVHKSKYAEEIEAFVSSNEQSSVVQLNGLKRESAYQSFHKVIKKNGYPVELVQRNGSLYIVKV